MQPRPTPSSLPLGFLLFLFALVAFVPNVFSGADAEVEQEAPPAAPTGPAASELTERIDVRRIEFSLLARDGAGRPVQDLTKSDLTVELNGQPVPLVYLEPLLNTKKSPVTLPKVRLRLEIGGAAENEVSEPNPPNYYMFFIDTENRSSPTARGHADALAQFVLETIKDQDLAAVVSYGNELRLESPFSSSKQQLTEAIANAYENRRPAQINARIRMERLTRDLELCIGGGDAQPFGAGSLARPGSVEPALMNIADLDPEPGCLEMMAGSYLSEVTPGIRSYLAALASAIDFGSSVNGDLTVFAVTHGVTVNPLSAFEEAVAAVFGPNASALETLSRIPTLGGVEDLMDHAIELAKKERAAFFFIDPTMAPAGLAGARMTGFYQPGARPVERAHESGQDVPKLVASETGGVFLEATNVLDGLRHSFELQKGRYVLGIDALDVPVPEDELQRIKIRTRRRDVSITHSRGLLMEGGDGGGLSGRIAVLPQPADQTQETKLTLPFAIGLDAADLEYLQDGDELATDLTLHITVQTLEGRHLVGLFHQLRHAVPRDAGIPEGQTRILTLKGSLEAPPGSYRLLAFVRNPNSNKESLIFREIELTGFDSRAASR